MIYEKDYLVVDLEIRKRVIERCVEELPNFGEFDSIVFCGNSGALVAMPVSYLAEKDVSVVRKDRDKNQHHSCLKVEGLNLSEKKFIIIDDFIASGGTIKYITDTVRSKFPSSILVGILLYKQDDLSLERITGLGLDPTVKVITFIDEECT